MVGFSDIASLLFDSNRKITGSSGVTVIPDLAIRERHSDRLGITAHPIQTGAAITDHAFVMQPEFTLEFGWSNSSISGIIQDFTGTSLTDVLTGDLGEGYIKQVYAKIISLQRSRQLCTVVTGKRQYKNVLIESVETYTDVETAYSMIVAMNCKALQLVSVATTSTASISQDSQANPASTSPEQSNGTKQLQNTTNESLLYGAWNTAKGIM